MTFEIDVGLTALVATDGHAVIVISDIVYGPTRGGGQLTWATVMEEDASNEQGDEGQQQKGNISCVEACFGYIRCQAA